MYAGSIGYWAFDNAVLWATFRAFGEPAPVTLVLMGYLIGQLGGLLPLLLGTPAFLSLRKGLNDPARADICRTPAVRA